MLAFLGPGGGGRDIRRVRSTAVLTHVSWSCALSRPCPVECRFVQCVLKLHAYAHSLATPRVRRCAGSARLGSPHGSALVSPCTACTARARACARRAPAPARHARALLALCSARARVRLVLGLSSARARLGNVGGGSVTWEAAVMLPKIPRRRRRPRWRRRRPEGAAWAKSTRTSQDVVARVGRRIRADIARTVDIPVDSSYK